MAAEQQRAQHQQHGAAAREEREQRAEEARLLDEARRDRLPREGGEDADGNLSSVERYDPAENVWEDVAPMATARISSVAVS